MWRRASATAVSFSGTRTRAGRRPSRRVLRAYDDRAIYFAVWVFDSDYRRISASELKRNAPLKKGDQIRIVIDPFRDKQNGFSLLDQPARRPEGRPVRR